MDIQLIEPNDQTPSMDMTKSELVSLTQRDISARRSLGVFYTPAEVTEVLCRWGIRKADDKVLEPSFGGCTFLESSISYLRKLGQQTPENQLFGCDIDPVAFEHLASILGPEISVGHFSRIDFLRLVPSALESDGFDAVIGNPPYIRSSHFSQAQRDAIKEWAAKYQIKVHGKASLWVYFVIHAMNFLKKGGRAAWVLPGSFLTSNYSKDLHEYLVSKFGRILTISVRERLFLSEGTEERSVLLLADDYQAEKPADRISIAHCDDVDKILQVVDSWEANGKLYETLLDNVGMSVIPEPARQILEALSLRPDIFRVGDLAKVKIGMVTGDNRYFIRRKKEWMSAGISIKHLIPVFPKMGWVSGIELTACQLNQLINEQIPCLMLDTTPEKWAPGLSDFLAEYPQEKIAKNATFAKRKDWHCIDYSGIPDAFLAYMTHLGPRLVVNSAKLNATNSVYRVYFNPQTDITRIKLTAIAINSTFSQLCSEGVGRGCGSGGLKLEPSEVLKVGLPMPEGIPDGEIHNNFIRIDQLLREEKHEEARSAADNFLFAYMGKNVAESLPVLEEGLIIARSRRMRSVP